MAERIDPPTRPDGLPPIGVQAGTDNLLQQCIGVGPGDSLLVVTEPAGKGFYDPRVAEAIAGRARALGLKVQVREAALVDTPAALPEPLLAAMRASDHVLFLSRLGDQLRFSEHESTASRTIAYTRDLEYLGSLFGCTPWSLFNAVHDRLLETILATKRYRITTATGTDLVGAVPANGADAALTEFTATCFPVVIYPPLECVGLSGRLVLEKCLMSTGINAYSSNVLMLEEPVTLEIELSRIIGISGPTAASRRVKDHLLQVAELFGGDPMAMLSWHTGIYPATFYRGSWRDDVAGWGDLVFASPRYTHFHCCGPSPGNVATTSLDATIRFDDEVLWDRGRPVFLERPEMRSLLETHGLSEAVYELREDIGV